MDLSPPVILDALRLQHVDARIRDNTVTPPFDTRMKLSLRLSNLGSETRPLRFGIRSLRLRSSTASTWREKPRRRRRSSPRESMSAWRGCIPTPRGLPRALRRTRGRGEHVLPRERHPEGRRRGSARGERGARRSPPREDRSPFGWRGDPRSGSTVSRGRLHRPEACALRGALLRESSRPGAARRVRSARGRARDRGLAFREGSASVSRSAPPPAPPPVPAARRRARQLPQSPPTQNEPPPPPFRVSIAEVRAKGGGIRFRDDVVEPPAALALELGEFSLKNLVLTHRLRRPRSRSQRASALPALRPRSA